jgi:hypothetical protein
MNWATIRYRSVWALLWLAVGVAKTAALVVFLTAADTSWQDALAYLLVAWGCAALALAWRARMAG